MLEPFRVKLAQYRNTSPTTLDEVETTLSEYWDAYQSDNDLPHSPVFEHAFDVDYKKIPGTPEESLIIEADLYSCHILNTTPTENDFLDATLYGPWRSTTSPVSSYLPHMLHRTPTVRDQFLDEHLQELFPD